MSGGGGGSQTQSTEPWAGQKPALRDVYRNASRQFNQPMGQRFQELGAGTRENFVADTTGINTRDGDAIRKRGLDANATRQAVRSGGFVPFTQYEQEAQRGAVDLARSGIDPSLASSQGLLANNKGIGGLSRKNLASEYLNDGAAGKYLTPDSNPYLRASVEAAQDPVVSRFNESVLPAISGQFGAAGRFGSPAHQRAVENASDDLSRNLSNAATQAYAGAYGQERGLQQGAQQALGQFDLNRNVALSQAIQRNAAIAPGLAGAIRQQQTGNLGLLEGVGGAQADKARELATMTQGAHDFRVDEPRTRLQQYAQLVQGGPAFSTTTAGGGGGTNRAAGALGGAATGAGMGSMFGPMGMGIGAAVGGLGGLLF